MGAAIGAVGEHLARVVGQRVRPGAPVVDVGRCDGNSLGQRCGCIGVDTWPSTPTHAML